MSPIYRVMYVLQLSHLWRNFEWEEKELTGDDQSIGRGSFIEFNSSSSFTSSREGGIINGNRIPLKVMIFCGVLFVGAYRVSLDIP